MSDQPKAIGFYANEGSLSSGNNLERSVPLKAAATTNHAAVEHAIPINGMTLNKELKDKQMTGIGGGGDPMFAVRSSGQQHAVAFAENSRAELRLCGGDGSVSAQLTTGGGKPGQGQACVAVGCMTPELPQRGRVHGIGGTSPTLSSEEGRGHGVPTVLAPDVYTTKLHNTSSNNAGKLFKERTTCLDANSPAPALVSSMAVRRLTPRECERLQGFPDDHTLIPWRGKWPQDCPDGPRYKALGNSMAVPCMAWIGKRIAGQHEGKVRYLSVCSGIEAASVAWEPLGWEPSAFAEVEKFPSAVLAHHWPQVPNLGDMTRHESWNLGAIDLLVGGTPCQSFSVAGLRKGLHDPRGGLMLTFLEIAQRQRPRWIVWENVPGVLSSHGGRDFGAFLGALGALGYGWAYRVLDAQWFGVAQRRRRVFVVGRLGDGAAAATVLFESESVQRNPAPSREKGQGVAADAAGGAGGRSWPAGVASTLRKENGSPGYANQDIFSQGGANLVPAIPETVGTLSDGAHNGGGLTAKMPTRAAYSPALANPLTARMGKGINTTLDEGQTPIVEGCDDL